MRLHILAALCLALAVPAVAQERHVVKFAKGNDNTYVEAKVKGDGYIDYVLGAKKGQTMAVSLTAKNSAYFNILPPGSTGEAIYNSSTTGNDAVIKLPSSGNFVIRVYLMGAAADEGKTVPFTLSMGIM